MFNTPTIYLPIKKLTNSELSKVYDTEEQKILKNTGIYSRHIAEADELASDMACKVLAHFFETNKLHKNDVDFLIFCSECFDYVAPATSCIIQDRIGLPKSIGCIDLPYGCSGYIYGLAIAKSLIISNIAQNILLVTADTPSKTINDNQFELKCLFSDAASATFLNKNNIIGDFVFGTDGSGHKDIHYANSGFRKNEDYAIKNKNISYNKEFIMNGINVFNFSLRVVPKLVNDVLIKNKCTFDEIDLFVFHQPTLFILQTLAKKMQIPKEKMYVNIENHGNTVSSSIPLALKDAQNEGKLTKGMTVLIAGFGVGLSWGATIIKY